MSSSLELPQPLQCPKQKYEYVLYENLEERFFSNTLTPGSLCWVLKSKGLQSFQENGTSLQRRELFQRARVVTDEKGDASDSMRRVLVRYPKGSTYHVKRRNLIPIIESIEFGRVVVIMAETPEYRRSAVVHTCIGDTFLEIGCDYGSCVDRVNRALHELPSVPRHPNCPPIHLPTIPDSQRWCLGIDKSLESIEIAKERYPNCYFSNLDVLSKEGTIPLKSLCDNVFPTKYPSIVAIDINGNREIPAVLQCMNNLMNPDSSEPLLLPRLILVKSRLLYHKLRDISPANLS
jgi:hypothetical protein